MSLARTMVEPGVERIRLSRWVGRAAGYDVSAYLLDDVLVDSGFPQVRDEVLRVVQETKPRGALITHWHEDHAGNVAALADQGLPLLMHPECERLLRERPGIRPYRRVVWGRSPRLTSEIVPFDPAPLQLIDTPGHSADHRVVWDPQRGIVVSGDLFLGVKVRVAHEHESPRALVASLRSIAALEPRLLLDAHRGVVSDGAAQLRAKADWTEAQIAAIERLAAAGVGVDAIVRLLFEGESLVGRLSGGEYSRAGFVRAVLHETN